MRRVESGLVNGRGVGVAFGLVLAAALSGCTNWDSYMDPSVVGRWERTPTRVPILKHLAAIEDPEALWVTQTEITPEDLIPQTDVYRVGPGDILSLTIWDLVSRNQAETLPRQVDQNGYIEIPQLGRIFVSGLTEPEVAEAVAAEMRDIVADPLVSVVVDQRRQQLYTLMGNVSGPGPYIVPSADYRLLEALGAAGGFPEFVDEILVIRQVPLTDSAGTLNPENPDDRFRGTPEAPPTRQGEELLDVINELSGGTDAGAAGANDAGDEPSGDMSDEDRAPAEPSTPVPVEPPIELIDSPAEVAEPDAAEPVAEARFMEPRWRYQGGRWVRDSIPAATRFEIGEGVAGSPQDSRGQLFTQRVIRVPVEPLVAGDARYNIIVRPGDLIRVPVAEVGNFYVDGEVNRPGVFNLPSVGRMTLLRAITAAGGLGALAIPERVDLTRMVGPDEQATIMLNLRAIAEGTQPDVYIHRDDRINIGTNFWATPLAVVRGGFRTSYGFGFLLDRNFGNDLFGAPPTNRFGQ